MRPEVREDGGVSRGHRLLRVRADPEALLEARHVTLGLNIVEGLENAALAIDDERRTDDAHHCGAISDLLAPDPVGLVHLTLGITQQVVGEAVPRAELPKLLRQVAGDSEDLVPGCLQRSEAVPEVARLRSAPRRHRFGVEEEDDGITAKVSQGDRAFVLVDEREVGRLGAGVKASHPPTLGAVPRPHTATSTTAAATLSAMSCSSAASGISTPGNRAN